MKTKNLIVVILSVFIGITTVSAQKSLADALKAIDQERYDLATTILLPLSKDADPKNIEQRVEAFYHLGDIYIQTNDLDSAKYCFEEGIKINPTFILNYVGRGEIDLMNGKKDAAQVTFDKAIMMLGKTKDYRPFLEIARAYYLLAKEKQDMHAVEKALSYEEPAKKFGSKVARVYVAFGNIHLLKHDATTAIANYNRALEFDKNYLSAYIGRSRIYRNAQNYEAAVEPLEEAIKLDPSYAPAYRELAELYAESTQYKKAIELYKDKYMPIIGSSCGSNTRYSQFLFLAHEYQEAYDVIKQLTGTCSVKPFMYRLLGFSAFEIDKISEAKSAMNLFFAQQDPNRILPIDYLYMAKIAIAGKEDSLAYIYLDKATELKVENTLELYSLLAKNNYSDKKYKLAIKAYEKILNHGGLLTAADYQRYGYSAYIDSAIVKADSAFARLKRLSPKHLLGYFYHARIMTNYDPTGEQALAKADYEKVIELGEADTTKRYKNQLIEAYTYMTDQSYRSKDIDAAIMYCEKILALKPDDEYAKANLPNLRKEKK